MEPDNLVQQEQSSSGSSVPTSPEVASRWLIGSTCCGLHSVELAWLRGPFMNISSLEDPFSEYQGRRFSMVFHLVPGSDVLLLLLLLFNQ